MERDNIVFNNSCFQRQSPDVDSACFFLSAHITFSCSNNIINLTTLFDEISAVSTFILSCIVFIISFVYTAHPHFTAKTKPLSNKTKQFGYYFLIQKFILKLLNFFYSDTLRTSFVVVVTAASNGISGILWNFFYRRLSTIIFLCSGFLNTYFLFLCVE